MTEGDEKELLIGNMALKAGVRHPETASTTMAEQDREAAQGRAPRQFGLSFLSTGWAQRDSVDWLP
jgi:hypothetical protein